MISKIKTSIIKINSTSCERYIKLTKEGIVRTKKRQPKRKPSKEIGTITDLINMKTQYCVRHVNAAY